LGGRTFGVHGEAVVDLREIQDHGQLVYLVAARHVAGGHDGRDAQLPLQKVQGQLVVVDRVGPVQRRHVTGTSHNGNVRRQLFAIFTIIS